jgi:hypothetical protein
MASHLNLANYTKFNDDICALLNTGTFTSVKVSVYTDAAASSVAVVNGTPIENLVVVKASCRQPYIDSQSGASINGSITVELEGGHQITAVDGSDNFWYVLSGNVFVPRRFGSSQPIA